jgi:hypothetical protein
MDAKEVFPVVCRELVAAPEGSAEEDMVTAPVFTAVILPSIEASDAISVA